MWRTTLVAFLLSASIVFSAEPLAPPEALHDGAPDGTGRVWACKAAANDSLLFHEGNGWRNFSFSPGNGLGWKPVGMAPLRDGSVLCVWQGATEVRLTRHRPSESTVWTKFEGTIGSASSGSVGITEDSVGNVWLTEIGPKIYRFAPDGSGGLVFTVPKDSLFTERPRPLEPLSITEDPRGRIWIWATSWGRSGVMLLYSEGKFEVLDSILPEDRPKQCPFMSVAVKDPKTLWISAINYGLGELDLDSMKYSRSAFPGNKNTIGSAAAIFEDKGAWYFVVNNPERRLWRWKEGLWSEVGEALGGWRGGRVDRKCRVIRTKEGILFEEIGSLFRFADMEKPPEVFDWRSGFNLRELERLYALPDGRIFALASNGKYFLGALKKPDRVAGRIRTMNHAFLWRPDNSGKLWATFDRNGAILNCWDGTEWKEFSIPKDVKAGYCSDLAFDSNGRVWLLPDSNELAVGILDPKTSTWKTYPKIEDAIDAGYVGFPKGESRSYVPAWSSDRKRAAFRSEKNHDLGYFDGRDWKRLPSKEIGPEGRGSGLPFFDKNGRLCVHIREDTWAYVNSRWSKVAWEPGPPDDIRGSKPDQEKPPGPSMKASESAVRDNLGAWWILRNDSFVKIWEDQTIPVFDEAEPNPMRDGRKIHSVFVDQAGNAFLKTTFGAVEIAPRSPVCDSTVQLEKVSVHAVALLADMPGAQSYRWRIDEGRWKNSKEGKILVKDLTAGRHVAEVASINRELIPDPTPAKIEFTLTYRTEDRIGELIERLGDAEFANREEALRSLVNLGKEALPQLRKAGETASDPWWIQAAIQEIERKQK